jgi:excinuclease UvrABC nuclease subunit
MKRAVKDLEFERAAQLRDEIKRLSEFTISNRSRGQAKQAD